MASVHERRGTSRRAESSSSIEGRPALLSIRRRVGDLTAVDDPTSAGRPAEFPAYPESLDATAEPISAGLSTTVTQAARRAEIFAAAAPDPRVMIAPA